MATSNPTLLSGGNPKIPMGDGDGPVQDYIAAMPGWKRALGELLDAAVMAAVPDAVKAVKWNSPFYGIAGRGWFLSLHCYAKFVRLAFFHGAALEPLPPGPSKVADVRYLDIREDDQIDAAQLADWLAQAARLPGWNP